MNIYYILPAIKSLLFGKFKGYKIFSAEWKDLVDIESDTYKPEDPILTEKLLQDIAHYKNCPKEVLRTDYFLRLGQRTYWIRNYPYSYGRAHPGYWAQGDSRVSPYFRDDDLINTSAGPVPSAVARYELNKFINEYGSEFIDCTFNARNCKFWANNPRKVIDDHDEVLESLFTADVSCYADSVTDGVYTAPTGEYER